MNLILFLIVAALLASIIMSALEMARANEREMREQWDRLRCNLGKTKCPQCAAIHDRASLWCSPECERAFFNLPPKAPDLFAHAGDRLPPVQGGGCKSPAHTLPRGGEINGRASMPSPGAPSPCDYPDTAAGDFHNQETKKGHNK